MSFLFLINKKFYNKENEGFQKIISEISEYSPSYSISLIYKYYSDYLKEVNSNNPMIQKYNSNFEKINIRIDQNKPHHFSYRKNMLIFPKD
jgi:TRAP-type C4-dicarboxylate transport system substrate-binding protein